MPRPRSPVPSTLLLAAARFDAWREERTTRGFPPGLWRLAVGLAGRHGVSATARALRLDYYTLARRVRPAGASRPAAPAFVEIVPGQRAGSCECVVEIENGEGARMRVRLAGGGVGEVVALERAFLRGRG